MALLFLLPTQPLVILDYLILWRNLYHNSLRYPNQHQASLFPRCIEQALIEIRQTLFLLIVSLYHIKTLLSFWLFLYLKNFLLLYLYAWKLLIRMEFVYSFEQSNLLMLHLPMKPIFPPRSMTLHSIHFLFLLLIHLIAQMRVLIILYQVAIMII